MLQEIKKYQRMHEYYDFGFRILRFLLKLSLGFVSCHRQSHYMLMALVAEILA